MQIHDFAGMSTAEREELARIIECCEARYDASSWDDPLSAGLPDDLELLAASAAGDGGLLHATL